MNNSKQNMVSETYKNSQDQALEERLSNMHEQMAGVTSRLDQTERALDLERATREDIIIEYRNIDTGIPIYLTAVDKGNGRGKEVIQAQLANWSGLALMCDAYPGYDWIKKTEREIRSMVMGKKAYYFLNYGKTLTEQSFFESAMTDFTEQFVIIN